MFGSTGAPASQPPPPEGLIKKDQEDPLKIGGQVYLRGQAAWYERQSGSEGPLSTPNLVDLFLDARPNDRVRAFALARTSWNPTGGGSAGPFQDLLGALGVPPASTASTQPRAVLDQLWLNFDADRKVFVTVGKQHVKWGVGKFWNPTDYLHPTKRDPLAVFDARTGTTMIRAHVPWEKYGWNFYGIGLLEDASGAAQPVDTVGRVGGGARAELVLGAAELGLDALVQKGNHPRFGVDLSAGIWELDLYSELAVRTQTDVGRWRQVDATAGLNQRYARVESSGFEPQLVVGGSWTRQYGKDQDTFTLGLEYFWNGFGYDDPHIYPFLLVGAPAWNGKEPVVGGVPSDYLTFRDPRAFTSFYLGRHYLGAYAMLPQPGSWNDTTFTLSALGNVTDKSFVVRLDHSVLVNTYLRVETFVSVNGGAKGGEFRLGLDLEPQLVVKGVAPDPDIYFPAQGSTLSIPAPVVSAGVALRVSL
ncbi:MAG: hypothetical protein QM704_08575 [Anaeromyxobacteraceae bacterium]